MNADELARILDELGQRLGPTGEYVFGLAVRQAQIDGWVIVGGLVIGLALVIWGAVAMRGHWNDTEAPARVLPLIAGGAVLFLAVVTFAASGAGKLLNPEYAALRDLLGAIKP